MTLLEELKEYLRIDGDYEDTTLNLFITSAQQFLQNAGVNLPQSYFAEEGQDDIYAMHRLAIYTLAAHYYENRQAVSSNAQNLVPYSVQTMVLQLKVGDVDEPGTI